MKQIMKNMTNVDAADDDKTLHITPRYNATKKIIVKKQAQAKQKKSVYIPRVWFEGKKMIIRGKAKLQQSNTEIFHKLQDKASNNRKKEHTTMTQNEIRCGSQTTLCNMMVNKKQKK